MDDVFRRAACLAAAALFQVSCASTRATAPPNTAHRLTSGVGAGFADGHAEVSGIDLHYVEGGKGSPVLLIPGWMQTWYAWRAEMPSLRDAGHQVIAVDPRGMGESSRPPDGYDTGRVAEDLHALMNKLGHQKYMVAGHDIGAWIAYSLAAQHPEAVERLVILEASIPGLLPPPAPEVFMPQEKTLFFWHFLFNQQRELPEILIQGRERAYLNWFFERWAHKPASIARDVYVDTYSAPGAVSAQLAYYRAFPETMAQNRKHATRQLPMPVLALGGDHSKGEAQLKLMQPVASDVRGGVLAECGHYAPEECPTALLEQMVPFFMSGQAAPR